MFLLVGRNEEVTVIVGTFFASSVFIYEAVDFEEEEGCLFSLALARPCLVESLALSGPILGYVVRFSPSP